MFIYYLYIKNYIYIYILLYSAIFSQRLQYIFSRICGSVMTLEDVKSAISDRWNICSNYSDLTRPHPKKVGKKGNSPKFSGKPRWRWNIIIWPRNMNKFSSQTMFLVVVSKMVQVGSWAMSLAYIVGIFPIENPAELLESQIDQIVTKCHTNFDIAGTICIIYIYIHIRYTYIRCTYTHLGKPSEQKISFRNSVYLSLRGCSPKDFACKPTRSLLLT